MSHRWLGRIGALALVLCAVAAMLVALAGQILSALALLPFIAVGGAIWARAGVTTVDGDGIGYHSPLGSFRLRWNDITGVLVDAHLSAVVFCSGRRRLVIIGPSLWTKGERLRTWSHLRRRIEALDLPVHYHPRTPFLLSRGTRVPRS